MRHKQIFWLRHPNGRGKLFDDSDVSKSSYLSEDSIVAGNCILRDACVTGNSRVINRARIYGGFIRRSIIAGNSIISGKPIINFSIIKDFAEVYDSPTILTPTIIEGEARLYGTAVIDSSELVRLSGKMRIASGVWTRAPGHIDLGFESVTESILGAMVGCRDRTVDYWLKHGPTFGRRLGLSEEQIEQLIEAVQNVQHH